MLFNSLHFLVFFPLVVVSYFALTPKYRTYLLLIASYYFYMCWEPEYVLLIAGSTVIDYFAAQKIYQSKKQATRKAWLWTSLAVNLGVLFFFKYFNFFSENISNTLNQLNVFYELPLYKFLLPVGISFYTFQTLSYTLDVYHGRLAPENNFARFALFVSFFPQLVAGPIERATHLLPQFKAVYNFEYERVVSGLKLMLWGFFKKLVVADLLAIYVNTVYNDVESFQGFPLIWATIFFAIQIYCDFSGYSDIAIGAARVMGFDLMTNFRQPYFSRSIREFWSRWHISLSTWFRDYLYIPLGGNRVVRWRWYYNLFVTFLVSGVWHGANWTFIVWGALHGVYLIIEILINQKQFKYNQSFKLAQIFRVGITVSLVCIAWVFFRANNVHDAVLVFTNVLDFSAGGLIGVATFTIKSFMMCLVGIMVVLCVDLFSACNWNLPKHRGVNYALVMIQLISIYCFGVFEEQAFIYFQF